MALTRTKSTSTLTEGVLLVGVCGFEGGSFLSKEPADQYQAEKCDDQEIRHVKVSRLDNRLSAWQYLEGKLKTICSVMLCVFSTAIDGRTRKSNLSIIALCMTGSIESCEQAKYSSERFLQRWDRGHNHGWPGAV